MCVVRSKEINSVLGVAIYEEKNGGHYAAVCPEDRSAGQLWYVVETESEDVMLISAESKNALEEWNDDSEWKYNGYYVGTSPPNGEDAQLWRIEGHITDCVLRNKGSGSVLDLFLGDDWWLGYGVGAIPSWGGRNQRWSLEPVFQHEVVSVEYAVEKKVILESKPVVVFSMDCTNKDSEPSVTVVDREVQGTNKYHWHFEWDESHKFFWKLASELTAPGPVTVEGGAESGGDHSIKFDSNHGGSSSASISFNLNQRVEVPGQSRKQLTLKSLESTVEIPFVAVVKIKHMHSGESKTEEVAGIWRGVTMHAFGVEISAAGPLNP